MAAVQSTYTSLKDVKLPATRILPQGSSWEEIPLKDPLLQRAAWAYMQPMPEIRRSFLDALKEKCHRVFGCVDGVVLVIFKGLFARQAIEADHHNVPQKY